MQAGVASLQHRETELVRPSRHATYSGEYETPFGPLVKVPATSPVS